MPTKLTPPSYHTLRRPSTAPQSRDHQQFQLSTGRRFDLSPSRPCTPLDRVKVSNLPPFGTSERSIEYLFDEGPFLSLPIRSGIRTSTSRLTIKGYTSLSHRHFPEERKQSGSFSTIDISNTCPPQTVNEMVTSSQQQLH